MNHPRFAPPVRSLLGTCLLLAFAIQAAGADPSATRFSASCFGNLARLNTLPAEDGGASFVQRVSVGDKTVGWIFRTDRLEPLVRGKRGQIATWVALGADGRIKAIEVAQHREDKAWFARLKKPFFRQFEGLAANGSERQPDAVATATLSSKAVIDDVMGACATVLKMPAVQAVLPCAAADALQSVPPPHETPTTPPR